MDRGLSRDCRFVLPPSVLSFDSTFGLPFWSFLGPYLDSRLTFQERFDPCIGHNSPHFFFLSVLIFLVLSMTKFWCRFIVISMYILCTLGTKKHNALG